MRALLEAALAATCKGEIVAPATIVGARSSTPRATAARGQGVEQALLDRVHAPIGPDIGAETPEEIAASIIGQIIAVMHGKASGAEGMPQAGRAMRQQQA